MRPLALLLLLAARAWAAPVPRLSEPRWVVPSPDLPPGLEVMSSNNNVALKLYKGRLYLAWRSAPIHFASTKAKLHVVSSPDLGKTWRHEVTIALGADLREPCFLSRGDRLILHFLEAGDKAWTWAPRGMRRVVRGPDGRWSAPEAFGEPGELPWEIKVREGRAYLSSYVGGHYDPRGSAVSLKLSTSDDGLAWRPADPARPVLYRGGLSELAFEFDDEGRFWGVARNEDGDETGFGSQVISAEPGFKSWTFPEKSDPRRYDSPRLFREGGELYLLARRDPGAPFDRGWAILPRMLRRLAYWAAYSASPKRTALFLLDRKARRPVPLLDLPSAGDTAFPSVERIGPGRWLVANYSSPPDDAGRSWFAGQLRATGIYLAELDFSAGTGPGPARTGPSGSAAAARATPARGR